MKLDNIHLRNIRLPLRLAIGSDAWHRNDKPQPAVISLRIGYPSALVDRAARNDTVGPTLDYGKLYRQIEADVGKTFSDEEGEYAPAARTVVKLASDISTTASELVWQTFADTDPLPRDELPLALWHEHKEIVVWIHLPKAILRADQGLKYRYRLDGMSLQSHKVTIEGIRCYCIIGINPHERREKQAVELGLEWSDRNGDDAGLTRMLACYQKLTQTVAETVDSSSFQTVEALATFVARIAAVDFDLKTITVRVEKPSAQPFVEYSGVEITRSASYFT